MPARKLPQPLRPFTQRPRCFDSQRQWVEWLALERSSRYTEPLRYGPCTDCTAAFQRAMTVAKRCDRPWLDLAYVAERKDSL